MRSWHPLFVRREITAGRAQLALFVLCVLLAALTVSSVSGWRSTVEQSLEEETRKGAGGDVVAFSTEPFSEGLLKAAQDFDHIRTNEMYTVAMVADSDLSLFSKLKSVEPGYPYYGEVPLRSGRELHQALKEGVVVEQSVTERLEVEPGDRLTIGYRTFVIADVYLSEPDRPMGMWGVSPRIFIADADLESTGLLRPDSYMERRIHIKLPDPQDSERVAEELRQVAVPDQERVESWRKPPVSIERYLDRFFMFLDMMALVAVSLGGLGMQSTLTTWLRSRAHTMALAKTLGAGSGFLVRHYGLVTALCTLLGFALGTAGAHLVLTRSGAYLTSMLPIEVEPALTVASVVQSGLLTVGVAIAFATLPLLGLRDVKPALVLRGEAVPPNRRTNTLWGACLALAAFVLIQAMVGESRRALWLTGLLILVLAVMALICSGAVAWLKRRRPAALALRTALGSWRAPEARPELVVFIVGTCLTVLYTMTLCERALRRSWLEAMPEDAPNLIFFDIQPDQLAGFQELVDLKEMNLYRNMRVRIQQINGKPLDRSGSRRYWERDGRGKLDASPATELPDNDTLLQGSALFEGDAADQVSVREDIAEALKIALGDRLTVTIQGIPVEATVSSIRDSSREGFRPSFELLFPPALVEGAPQTLFVNTRLPENEIGAFQSKVARAYPGIISMDLSQTVTLVAERLFQIVGLARFFLTAGLCSGLLILCSALWSARERRTREAAYLKVMGASQGFLHRVLWLENGLLGLLCSGLGFVVAYLLTLGLCTYTLEVDPPPVADIVLPFVAGPALLVALIARGLSQGVLKARPAPYLREG